jgi:hypothetical protein
MRETDVLIADHAFNLVEFGQVSGVKGLISEDAVYTEPFHWFEHTTCFGLLCHLEQHLGADCGSVGAQNVLF